jgi:hypothetical protein
MLYQSALPSRPLTQADIERLRSHPDVQSLIALGSASPNSYEVSRHQPISRAVVLSGDMVLKFQYEGSGWSTEVLKTKASQTDLLPLALKELSEG